MGFPAWMNLIFKIIMAVVSILLGANQLKLHVEQQEIKAQCEAVMSHSDVMVEE